ncbi:hypothetical protein F5Y09DRAFT_337756 [Xylaria sp. FL1042]|nr:hypothetical protein F5Y09DRAFT_337756 [Xylaria sp. FL1042]
MKVCTSIFLLLGLCAQTWAQSSSSSSSSSTSTSTDTSTTTTSTTSTTTTTTTTSIVIPTTTTTTTSTTTTTMPTTTTTTTTTTTMPTTTTTTSSMTTTTTTSSTTTSTTTTTTTTTTRRRRPRPPFFPPRPRPRPPFFPPRPRPRPPPAPESHPVPQPTLPPPNPSLPVSPLPIEPSPPGQTLVQPRDIHASKAIHPPKAHHRPIGPPGPPGPPENVPKNSASISGPTISSVLVIAATLFFAPIYYTPLYEEIFTYATDYSPEPLPGWSQPSSTYNSSYGMEEERNAGYYEPEYLHQTRRPRYSDRLSGEQHPFYFAPDRSLDRHYQYPREELYTKTSNYSPRSYADYQESYISYSTTHKSRSRGKKHKPHKSSSRVHDSHSHEKDRKSHKSSKAHASRSHGAKKEQYASSSPRHVSHSGKERKTGKSSSRAHVPSNAPESPRRSKNERSSSVAGSRKAKRDGSRTGSLEPEDDPDAPTQNIPLSIKKALEVGKNALEFLQFTIHVVLLYEWCYKGYELHTHPGEFRSYFKVIPVEHDAFGQFKPIEDPEGEWGVKTEYDSQYNTYLETILIRVPSVLTKVKYSQLKSAYKRFAAKPRIERLKDLYELPFKDDARFRKYAIMFQFQSGSEKPRLFDDYLQEDAVIKIRA